MTSFPIESRYAASGVHFWNEFVPTLTQNCDKDCPVCDGVDVSSGYVVSTCRVLMCIVLCAFYI